MKNMAKGLLAGLGLMISLSAQQALAIKFPLPDPDLASPDKNLPEWSADAENYDFNGIIRLNNCSGSLIRFEQSQDQDAAIVMTNGHCVPGMVDPGEYLYRESSSRSFSVLDSGGRSVGSVKANQLIYATMTKTDIALYRLSLSYQDIKNRYGADALTLSESGPLPGDPIEVISGYWRRGYSCGVETIVHQLREASWSFVDSIRYSRPGCETIGGTSGSPIILGGSRTVIGINNTGNESGQECTLNNPCEVNERGEVYYERGLSYGQQTHWIYSCLNDQRVLDLSLDGCQLPGH